MKNSKIALLFTLLLLLSLTAISCSGSSDATPAAATETPGETTAAATAAEETSEAQTSTTAAATTAAEASTAGLGNLESFSAQDVDGNPFSQDDLADYDLTVVNFWALTCGPCLAEMPDLAALQEALPPSVQLITVCLDGAYDLDTTASVLDEAGYHGVTLVAGDGDLSALCGQLRYTPTTLFFDSEGKAVGETIIGGQRDLAASYTAAINDALALLGKEAISLDK